MRAAYPELETSFNRIVTKMLHLLYTYVEEGFQNQVKILRILTKFLKTMEKPLPSLEGGLQAHFCRELDVCLYYIELLNLLRYSNVN